MKGLVSVSAVLALLLVVPVAQAEDLAATQELPAALQAIGVSQDTVVSEQEATEVRGQFVLPNIINLGFSQTKTMEISGGFVSGDVQMFEGVIAEFQYDKIYQDPVTGETLHLTVEGTLGGLAGGIGINQEPGPGYGELDFFVAGKTFTEVLEISSGNFSQLFSQTFIPIVGP